MNILHDFNLGLKHFTIPVFLFKKIEKKGYKLVDYKTSSKVEKESCEIFFGNRITTKCLDSLPRLKYIHLGCVGYDKLNLSILKSKKIILTNSSNIVESAMSETTLLAIMWFNKNFNFLNNTNNFSRIFFDQLYKNFKPMNEIRVLIYGHGKVSSELINLLRKFTNNISVVVRNPEKCSFDGEIINIKESLNLVHNYDYVVNCLPLNPTSKKYFNKNFFYKMSRSSVYINIGRSATTVFKDLKDSVKRNKIKGTYLDVYEKDEIGKDIIEDQRFLISPHISGWTTNYWSSQSELFLNNLDNYELFNYDCLLNKILYE